MLGYKLLGYILYSGQRKLRTDLEDLWPFGYLQILAWNFSQKLLRGVLKLKNTK